MPIHFRKAKAGPELDLVNKFLGHFKEIFGKDGLEITVLKEPYAEVGIPDLLFVVWNKGWEKNWRPERSHLQKNDIKIMHYISTFGKRGVREEAISTNLSFSSDAVSKTLGKLKTANLISARHKHVVLQDISNTFFIKKIISVEAKINDWKNAVLQAEQNQNFCSHSYVLLPEKRTSESIIAACSEKLGVLMYSGNRPVVRKKAQTNKIPGSYFSWVVNEYLGRQHIASISNGNVS